MPLARALASRILRDEVTINRLPPVATPVATERVDTGGSFVLETVIVRDTEGRRELDLDALAPTRFDFFLSEALELFAVKLFLAPAFLAAFFFAAERFFAPGRFLALGRFLAAEALLRAAGFLAAEALLRAAVFLAAAVFFDTRTFFEPARVLFFLLVFFVDLMTRFRFALAFACGVVFFFEFFFFAATIHSEQMK